MWEVSQLKWKLNEHLSLFVLQHDDLDFELLSKYVSGLFDLALDTRTRVTSLVYQIYFFISILTF